MMSKLCLSCSLSVDNIEAAIIARPEQHVAVTQATRQVAIVVVNLKNSQL